MGKLFINLNATQTSFEFPRVVEQTVFVISCILSKGVELCATGPALVPDVVCVVDRYTLFNFLGQKVILFLIQDIHYHLP